MIIFFKNIKKIGGPSSFQKKFIEWLKKNKIEYDFLKKNNIFKKKILFINSGTFNILLLFISSLYKTKITLPVKSLLDISSLINLITNSFLIPPVPAPINGKATELIFLFKQILKAFFVDSLIDFSVATQKIFNPAT